MLEARYRGGTRSTFGYVEQDARFADQAKSKSKVGLLTTRHWLTLILGLLLIKTLADYECDRTPVPIDDTLRYDVFVEARARSYLDGITSFGFRHVGSDVNEIQTANYILSALEDIKKKANPAHRVSITTQHPSGAFFLGFLSGFTSVYRNLTNVIARIEPAGGAKESILINCHFDSASQAIGASDDAAGCAIMLESLSVISRRSKPLTRGIVFLFNGAEESILPAAHGFITQHPWAKTLKAFINLEAAGSAGREILFQSGPGIISMYATSAPHPFATVVAQDVFSSGIIPSDSDFRIFRDFGHLPGVDFAYYCNGYVYHTVYDTADRVPRGSLQRSGDNILAMAAHMADVEDLLGRPEQKVFFDLAGLTMVVYPLSFGLILNAVLLVAVTLHFVRQIVAPGTTYLKLLIFGVMSQIAVMFVVVITTLSLAVFVQWSGVVLSWYTRGWLLFGLYAAPAIAVALVCHRIAALFADRYITTNVYMVEYCIFDSVLLVHSLILFLLTAKGLGSSYISFYFGVLFPFTGRLILGNTAKRSAWALLGQHSAAMIISYFYIFYLYDIVFDMFIPLLGRTGTAAPPEVTMSIIVVLCVFAVGLYATSLIYATTSIRSLLKLLLSVSFVTYMLILFTSMGFPFNIHREYPAAQRFIVQHTHRTIRNMEGEVTKEDSDIWLLPVDYSGVEKIRAAGFAPLEQARRASCEGISCGLPYFFPLADLFPSESTWLIPAPPAFKPPGDARLELVDRSVVGANRHELTFNLFCPSHCSVVLSPLNLVHALSWTLTSQMPRATYGAPHVERDTWFLLYRHGIDPGGPLRFSIVLGVVGEAGDRLMETAVCSHDVDSPSASEPLNDFVRQLPEWATAIFAVSSFNHQFF